MERLAGGDHAVLVRRRRLNSIARGRGRVSDYGDANVVVEPQQSAVGLDVRIPCRQLHYRDALRGGDCGACVSGLHLIEVITVTHHAGLDGRRGGYAVASCGGGGRRNGWGVTDDGDASIGVSPESSTCRTRARVPALELSHSDTVFS